LSQSYNNPHMSEIKENSEDAYATNEEPNDQYQTLRSPSGTRQNLCERHQQMEPTRLEMSASSITPSHMQQRVGSVEKRDTSIEHTHQRLESNQQSLNEDLEMIRDDGVYRPIRSPYEGFNEMHYRGSSPSECHGSEPPSFHCHGPPDYLIPHHR